MFVLRLFRAAALALLTVIGVAGCIVPEGAIPAVDLSAVVATQYMHRGMVQVNDEVVQGEMRAHLPTTDGGTLTAIAFGNVNLNDDIGDSWFPDGKGGRVTETELGVSYSRELGPVSLTAGVLSYILPDGREFPNGVRGSTTEVFGTVAGELLGFQPAITVHYDGDEVDGFYFNGSVRRPFSISDRFRADLGVSLGYSTRDEADWTYGIETAGFSDLKGEARLFYDHNDNTTFMLGVAGSTIVDDKIEDWFEVIDIESDNVWVFLGILWSF